jgi:hypothetical protein
VGIYKELRVMLIRHPRVFALTSFNVAKADTFAMVFLAHVVQEKYIVGVEFLLELADWYGHIPIKP